MTPPKDRERIKKAARYAAVVMFMAISILPVAATVPISGAINLLFLLILWALLLVAARKLPRRFAISVAVIFALAMTFPPVFTYVSISGERPEFRFIGLEHILGGSVWGIIYPFIFSLAIFIAVIFLIRRKIMKI